MVQAARDLNAIRWAKAPYLQLACTECGKTVKVRLPKLFKGVCRPCQMKRANTKRRRKGS